MEGEYGTDVVGEDEDDKEEGGGRVCAVGGGEQVTCVG